MFRVNIGSKLMWTYRKNSSRNFPPHYKGGHVRKKYCSQNHEISRFSWIFMIKFGRQKLNSLGIHFFVIINIARYLWKCLQNFQVKSNQPMNLVELRHLFEDSKCIGEEPNLSETTEIHNQNISSDRIIQYPA